MGLPAIKANDINAEQELTPRFHNKVDEYLRPANARQEPMILLVIQPEKQKCLYRVGDDDVIFRKESEAAAVPATK